MIETNLTDNNCQKRALTNEKYLKAGETSEGRLTQILKDRWGKVGGDKKDARMKARRWESMWQVQGATGNQIGSSNKFA